MNHEDAYNYPSGNRLFKRFNACRFHLLYATFFQKVKTRHVNLARSFAANRIAFPSVGDVEDGDTEIGS
jgi:hypothetical protein